VDAIAKSLMDLYIKHLSEKPNGHGGIWRCGTGSAQNYIYDAAKCPATPDGRLAGTPYACSFSPAPGARVAGPLSVIRAFTSMDLTRCINGGPLTMEIHHNVFRNEEGEAKVAQLAKLFVLSGGHQLQLNALNRETLLDAQKHPEDHQGLVVRVWGWSGYFCELDPVFQEHILSRIQYTV
jgi:formate C-acetyltransferase